MLSNNYITQINLNGYFLPYSLLKLNLNHNNIGSIQNWFDQRKRNQIKKIEIINNKITKISDSSFRRLQELEYLDLSFNAIRMIENNCFQSSSIKILNIRSNHLEVIKNYYFEHLNDLLILDLSMNRISLINPKSFESQNKLIKLDLSNNQLTQLKSSDFFGLNSLETLDLSSNKLNYLEESSFKHLNNIKEILFSSTEENNLSKNYSNPIHCDCNLEWMLKPKWQHIIKGLYCATPKKYENKLFNLTDITKNNQIERNNSVNSNELPCMLSDIKLSASSNFIISGNLISFKCDSLPRGNIKWYLNNKPIMANEKITIKFNFSNHFLTKSYNSKLFNVTCLSKQLAGSNSASIHMRIHEKRSWNLNKTNEIIVDNCTKGSIEISCKVDGNPDPTITWLKLNDNENNKWTKIANETNTYLKYKNILVINKQVEANTNIFQCQASNKIGKINKFVSVTIKSCSSRNIAIFNVTENIYPLEKYIQPEHKFFKSDY